MIETFWLTLLKKEYYVSHLLSSGVKIADKLIVIKNK